MADTATQRPSNVPGFGATSVGSPKSNKKKASQAQEQAASQVDDAQSNLNDDETNGNYEENEQTEADERSEVVPAGSVDQDGNVVDADGNIIGKVNGETLSHLVGSVVDQDGDVLDDDGNVIGKAEAIQDAAESAQGAAESVQDATNTEKPELNAPFGVQDNGDITNATGVPVGKLVEGDPKDLVGTSIKEIDEQGQLQAESGSIIGKAELLEKVEEVAGTEVPERTGSAAGTDVLEQAGAASTAVRTEVPENAEAAGTEVGKDVPDDVQKTELPDLSLLEGKKVNKLGKIVDEEGKPFGQLVEGDAKKLAGKKVDAEGKIWDDTGKVIGRAEVLPESEREPAPSSPFEDFPDSIVDKSGNVMYEGQIIGKLVEGDAKKLAGKKVDADGDILDKNGNVLGKAERYEEEEAEPEEPEVTDLSILEGKKVNKAGNLVDDNGKLLGRVTEGVLAKLVGKKADVEGKIWGDSGKVIGAAELIPMDERDQASGAPFEGFPDAIVDKNGKVIFEGQVVGRLIEGDGKKLAGKKVDQDGEVVDKIGNVLGKAERWEEEVPEPEPVDLSALAGKRVNKIGNLVDSNGNIFGRLVEGDPKTLAGKMCDKDGNIWNDGGQIVGKAELVPDSERQGQKDDPFSGFDNPVVTKDGKVADSKGTIIGRLTEGDAKKLYGRAVDPDGDVLDNNGNTIGKAERWEEEVKEKPRHPAAGHKVNREGNVVDENGDVIAKLTEGEVTKCARKEIDDDGDVVDGKGTSIGHVTLLEDIPAPPPEEPKESEEEIEKRKQLEQDRKLANQMAGCIQQSIDKIKPILTMITDAIDAAERQPKDELDEQKLVDTVRPLIEQGSQILQEANGVIRGLDPDGRIQGKAKGKAASREATPEEYRLADVLKELTENVAQTIERSKKKIAGMPHAKKELNPLWGLLAEPLGQILAAVGLLLSGVLGLVGRLLNVLGLGGLLDNLLGGLGIKGVLEGLGLGALTKSLTGKK